jgi:hypothetical protein
MRAVPDGTAERTGMPGMKTKDGIDMTINQAIRILDPDTSVEALGEIEYYGGLHGHEKMMAACEEACRMAVEIMRQHLKD